jgi:hypothetical protein
MHPVNFYASQESKWEISLSKEDWAHGKKDKQRPLHLTQHNKLQLRRAQWHGLDHRSCQNSHYQKLPLPFSPLLIYLQRQQNMSAKRPPKLAPSIFLFLLVLLHDQIHASPIKSVVVLVMENRSFDHMLGWMKKINPEINGVDGTQWNPLNITDPNSPKFFFNNQAQYVDPDPGHSFQAIREQIFGSEDTSKNPPPMNGFAQQAFSMDPSANMSRDVMNGFEPDMLAVYRALVSEFAVFDRYSHSFLSVQI